MDSSRNKSGILKQTKVDRTPVKDNQIEDADSEEYTPVGETKDEIPSRMDFSSVIED